MKTFLDEVLDSELNIPQIISKHSLECKCSFCKGKRNLNLKEENDNYNEFIEQEHPGVAIAAAAITAAATVIPGILTSDGGVLLELAQMPGFLHPNDKLNKRKVFKTYTWERVGHELPTTTSRVGAYFNIDFDTNGESIGNVFISSADPMDPYRANLKVTAQISKDANTYTVGKIKMRQVKIVFIFQYEFTFASNETWRLECVLRGDGNLWFPKQAYKTST